MPNYKVTIIKESQIELLHLQKIITDYCMDIKIIGVAETIEEGIALMENEKPDIVFFGVEFYDSLIFDHIEKFNLKDVQIIFISSVKEYAVNAFQSNAVDYILKPIKPENIILSINKSIKRIKMNIFCEANEFSTQVLKESDKNFDFIVVTSLDKIDFIKTEDIMYCTSDGKYTTFYLMNGKNIVSSKNIGVYEKLLAGFYFYRIHHSYILNIKYLISIKKKDGNYCELPHNISLPIAKRRQEDFYKILKLKI